MPTHLPAPTNLASPRIDTLKPGDILLPRRLDVHVPFIKPTPTLSTQKWSAKQANSTTGSDEAARVLWNAALDLMALQPQEARDYFVRLQAHDQTPAEWKALLGALSGAVQTQSSGGIGQAIFAGLYVGHSAMVIDPPPGTQTPWLIESSHTHGGVRAVSYADWLAERQTVPAGQPVPNVWHARIVLDSGDAITAEQATAMCQQAHRLRMLRKRYAIFDKPVPGVAGQGLLGIAPLGDENYVYCSELIYICAKQALRIDLAADTRNELIGLVAPFLGPRQLSDSHYLKWLNLPGGQRYGD